MKIPRKTGAVGGGELEGARLSRAWRRIRPCSGGRSRLRSRPWLARVATRRAERERCNERQKPHSNLRVASRGARAALHAHPQKKIGCARLAYITRASPAHAELALPHLFGSA